jgi:hypothetical protein
MARGRRFPDSAKDYAVLPARVAVLIWTMVLKLLRELRNHAPAEGRFLGFPVIFPVLREKPASAGVRLRPHGRIALALTCRVRAASCRLLTPNIATIGIGARSL